MSLDPMKYQPTFFNTVLPYHHSHFWLNLKHQELQFSEGNVAAQGSYVMPNIGKEPLIVYETRDNAHLAPCLRIPGRPAEDAAYDVPNFQRVMLPNEYQLFGYSNRNPLDVYASGLTQHAVPSARHEPEDVTTTMPKPLHRVPNSRLQHYHQRHKAQAKHPQANNLKNKTRFSATGLSSNYTVIRDTKMSLSSAPSSPSAGSVGGSLGYLVSRPHLASSTAYCVPQYKGSSSSSSCCSTTGLKISSSSMSSYSSRSSMSSTPSLSGISPRKRRAEDVLANARKSCSRRDDCCRNNEGEITSLCSCESCAADEVASRVDGVSLRDRMVENLGQQHKRSKNDDDIVFVSAVPGPSARSQQKEKATKKNRKSTKKGNCSKQAVAIQPTATQLRNVFPFAVPTTRVSTERRDVGGRYFLRSAVKGRRQEDTDLRKPAVQPQHPYNCSDLPPMTKPFVRLSDTDDSSSVVTESSPNNQDKSVEIREPRYHTRSVQKKVNADQQKPKVQAASIATYSKAVDNHCDAKSLPPKVNYQTTSVIQSAETSPNCNKQSYIPTSSMSGPETESAKDTRTSSSVMKKLYDIHGVIGVGGGGTVYAGTRKADGVQVAIKQVPKAKVKRWGRLNNRVVPIEFELLYRASHSGHEGVISMLDWYERRTSYVLVMERPQPVIDLFDYLNQNGALPEPAARTIFKQIAEAVLHCHANGVVHRDIKDENVIINLHTSQAKLIDFGCGTVLKDAPFTEFAGTPEFYPPEWFTHRRYYGQRVDAWSLGVLLFTMVEAEVPFQQEKDIVECKLRHKNPEILSNSCKDLIAWMLQKDQDMRPTIEQALNHRWFREDDIRLGTPSSPKSVSGEVLETDELYENRLHCSQSGTNSPVKGNENQHEVAQSDSPESPVRYAVEGGLFYQTQSTCQSSPENSGVCQSMRAARW